MQSKGAYNRAISISTAQQAEEIAEARIKAHEKHSYNSIESVGSNDRLLTILTEEVGEIAEAINDSVIFRWDENRTSVEIRSELIDVMTVCSAWVSRLDRETNA